MGDFIWCIAKEHHRSDFAIHLLNTTLESLARCESARDESPVEMTGHFSHT